MKEKNGLAVVLVSGGLDSCVTAAIAAEEYDLALLHVDYGQRTEQRERKAFEEIAKHYGVPEDRQMVVRFAHFAKIGGSSLTDESIPVSEADLDSKEIPTSYVPFRNAQFLSVAVSWAEVLGANKVYIGAVWEDSSGYPDCRPEFYRLFNQLVSAGTRPETEVEVVTPLIQLEKQEIVRQGIALGAPLHLTWSCYQNEEVACGTCDSCALRRRAFDRAGVRDPIPYREEIRYT
jgi:7-cyano-7-deazaguanine synthase